MKYKFYTKPARDALQVLYCDRDENLRPGVRYGPVIRNVYIIECCRAGYGSVIINGREFPVGPGDCYILLPGDTIIHTADKVEPRCGVSCVANGLALNGLLQKAGISSVQPYAPKEVFHEIYDLIEEMLGTENDSNVSSEMHRTACLYHILGHLFRECRNADKDAVVQKAIGIMETRYREDLTTQVLADYTGLERSYFSTFFKNHTGIPPHRYLTKLRVQKACILIDKDDTPVAKVAESVGLDPQNFARIFKKEMGITPIQYRMRLVK